MKILVVLPRFPYPLDKGDKLRAYNQIKVLSQRNEIYLFCLTHERVAEDHIEALRPWCKDMTVVQSPLLVNYWNVVRNYVATKSLQMGYWDSVKVRRAYKAFEKRVDPDVVYNQMVRTMPWVSRSPRPKVMDFQDALSMNTERRMEQAHGLWRHFLHFEFKMLRSTEYNAFRIFDALTIISEPDSNAIPHQRNGDIHIIPNGVDFDYFKPIEREKKYDMVFCGNMRYEPNVRAAHYLIEKVLPIVWQTMPEATLLLAGKDPKSVIWKMQSERVTICPSPADIRECYASAKVLTAPMQTGSGLQNKLLEAMSMRIPCVTTNIANDSLHAADGKEVLVADNAETFASHIVNLLRDDELRNTVAEAGYQFVTSTYSWQQECEKLEQVLQEVVDKNKKG